MAQEIRSPFQTRTENEDEVRNLADLIDARENPSQDDVAVREIQGDDEDLDIEDALTFPRKKRRREDEIPDVTDFDADARTSSAPDDPDDASYMTRADFVDSMNETDPDPNAGRDERDFLGDADLGRAPDITGTVTGINRGMATHLPQDIGRDGFQIEEPEAAGDPSVLGPGDVVDDEDDMADPTMRGNNDFLNEDESLLEDDLASDGGRIPTRAPDVDTRDEALDATRRIE
jgi:hypothetical protein